MILGLVIVIIILILLLTAKKDKKFIEKPTPMQEPEIIKEYEIKIPKHLITSMFDLFIYTKMPDVNGVTKSWYTYPSDGDDNKEYYVLHTLSSIRPQLYKGNYQISDGEIIIEEIKF